MVKSVQYSLAYSKENLIDLRLILYIIIWFSGVILIIQDIKMRSVTLLTLSVFFITCCCIGILGKNFAFTPILVFTIIGTILKSQAFGVADYIVVIAISFLITNEQSMIFITLCGLFGMIASFIFKKQKFPFIPAMLLACVMTCLFSDYL